MTLHDTKDVKIVMIKLAYFIIFLVLPLQAFAESKGPFNHNLPQYEKLLLHKKENTASKIFNHNISHDYASILSKIEIDKTVLLPGVYADGSDGTLEQIGRMADSSVQKVDANLPGGYATLDMSGAVVSPIVGSIASAPYTPNGRTLSQSTEDEINIKDLGAKMGNATGIEDQKSISKAFGENISGKKIVIPTGRWPNQQTIPKAVSQTDYVEVLGRLSAYPMFPVVEHGLGIGVPYFGDGVTSLTHNPGDGSDVEYARVDSNNLASKTGRPMASFVYVNDTPHENGLMTGAGHMAVNITTVSTLKGAGNVNDLTLRGIYEGNNYGNEFDVTNWNHTQIYGTNWVWANIDEMYEFSPFFCKKGEEQNCSARYLYEDDMGGIGNEIADSTFDPTAVHRKMFWLTTNHNINNTSTADVRWRSNHLYEKHSIISLPDTTGQEWMYESGEENGKTGNLEPKWQYKLGETFHDGDVIWTNVGRWQYDLGAVFAIGGANDSKHAERIGTLMYEEVDKIYNSIFDMSKANFEDNIIHVFARLQKDMYFDLTADGTKQGQNNHLLGYNNKSSQLEYKVNKKVVFAVKDDGQLVTSKPIHLISKNRKQIRQIDSPERGMEVYDADDDTVAIYTKAGWRLLNLKEMPD